MNDTKEGPMDDAMLKEIFRRLDSIEAMLLSDRKEDRLKHDELLIRVTELSTREKMRQEAEARRVEERERETEKHMLEHDSMWKKIRSNDGNWKRITIIFATLVAAGQVGWMLYTHFSNKPVQTVVAPRSAP